MREATFIFYFIYTKFRPPRPKLSSRTTADLDQPPFRTTAAVCRCAAPLGRGTGPTGRNLTVLGAVLAKNVMILIRYTVGDVMFSASDCATEQQQFMFAVSQDDSEIAVSGPIGRAGLFLRSFARSFAGAIGGCGSQPTGVCPGQLILTNPLRFVGDDTLFLLKLPTANCQLQCGHWGKVKGPNLGGPSSKSLYRGDSRWAGVCRVEGSDDVLGLTTAGSIFAFHNLFAKEDAKEAVAAAASASKVAATNAGDGGGGAASDEQACKRLKQTGP